MGHRVAFFATCLVDQFYPEVGVAALRVLERCGVKAEFPHGQTCCGQPFFNMGYRAQARKLALHTLDVFSGYDAVVMPSGSCASMIRTHYADLFAPDDPARTRVAELAARTFEFTQYLVNVLRVTDVGAAFDGTVTYHDGCHALREIGITSEPRTLLRAVKGCTLKEAPAGGTCCGFGGTFSVKFGDISAAIVNDKADALCSTGADVFVTADVSCMMQIAGALSRRGSKLRALHIAQLLAS